MSRFDSSNIGYLKEYCKEKTRFVRSVRRNYGDRQPFLERKIFLERLAGSIAIGRILFVGVNELSLKGGCG